jgi:hypothetical protein
VVTPARVGTITIAGQRFTVNQTGCTYGIAPTSATLGADAGSGAVSITTASVCQWTVSGLPVWASTMAGASGTGPGTWQYSMVANTTGSFRSLDVSVAGLTFGLNQLGTNLKPLVPGTRTRFSLANGLDQYWASIEAVAGRSYCAQVTPAVTAVDASTPSISAFRGDSIATLGPSGGRRRCFVAPATERVLFKTTQSDGSVRPHVLSVVETTLWANWWFVGGDYSSYTILRNTTSRAVTATMTWRSLTGEPVENETLVVPAGGVIFRDARQARWRLRTAEKPQALEGSQTTLSATTGQSFDTVMGRRAP